ncbi:MAG: lactate racemase domain-containing protein [Sphaerochaetaceae bacterium]
MNKLEAMVSTYGLPKLAKLSQQFDRTRLINPEKKLLELLEEKVPLLPKGSRIAITAGSRGIAQYCSLMKIVVFFLKGKGYKPFLVPAMGSHGGGTAEGQLAILANLGITEESVGAPILSSMEVIQVATTLQGIPVWIDKNAVEADGIVLLNRVKPHTSIREKYQSGLIKMMAIGLAKHIGATATHSLGTLQLGPTMVSVGTTALHVLNIVAGISVIENGYEELADIYVSRKNEILETEPLILERATSLVPTIKIQKIDCLIVCEQGKDISGTGMDPAIIGRPINRRVNEGPSVESLGVLRLTSCSDGNASGCGLADFITKDFRDQIDEIVTDVNSLTGMHPEIARIPITLSSDKLVFQACVKASGIRNLEDLKMVVIKNTKSLDEIYVSPASFASVKDRQDIQLLSDFQNIPFDDNDRFAIYDKCNF